MFYDIGGNEMERISEVEKTIVVYWTEMTVSPLREDRHYIHSCHKEFSGREDDSVISDFISKLLETKGVRNVYKKEIETRTNIYFYN